jgi:cellulose synthase/poly-beta-1,6-N-acetylglucosamine synthase-like glycosyltransferase
LPPQITVGICAYNEGKNIGKLLDNILNEQKFEEDYELIVVCSGCTDDTVEIVMSFQEQTSKVRLFVECERKGKASAINRIFSEAKGKVIIFVSADTLPNKDCFNNLLLKLKLPNVGIVCGNPTPINSKKPLVGKLVHLLWGFHDIVFRELNDAGLARHATEVFCIRRGIVKQIPNETINDDAYIALMTKKKGWLIKYQPTSHVFICGPQTFNDYFQQRRRILVGHLQVKKITGESPQHLIYLLPKQPIRVLKLWFLLFRKNSFFTVLAFVSIEFMTNCIAISDYLSKKSYTKWVVSSSTKDLAKLKQPVEQFSGKRVSTNCKKKSQILQ